MNKKVNILLTYQKKKKRIVSDGNNLKLSSGSSGIVMTNSGFSNTFINGTPLSTFSFNNYPSDW